MNYILISFKNDTNNWLCIFEIESYATQAGLELTLVTEDNLELPVLLPLPPKCALLCLASSILEIRDSCFLKYKNLMFQVIDLP